MWRLPRGYIKDSYNPLSYSLAIDVLKPPKNDMKS